MSTDEMRYKTSLDWADVPANVISDLTAFSRSYIARRGSRSVQCSISDKSDRPDVAGAARRTEGRRSARVIGVLAGCPLRVSTSATPR